MQITDSNRAPNLLPVTLVLSVFLWLFTMTGGRDIFVKEVLGSAYDSQAEHFLRGDVDVDAEAIRHEATIVNDHVRMYFGPFPALLRIPLNFLYPAGHGKWSRISGFCAGAISLFAFAGLVRMFYAEDKVRLRDAMRERGLTEVRFRFEPEGTKILSQ